MVVTVLVSDCVRDEVAVEVIVETTVAVSVELAEDVTVFDSDDDIVVDSVEL